jgi:hypothetical protein
VNRNTAIQYFHKLRELIAENLAADALDLMAGNIEVDESYFGGLNSMSAPKLITLDLLQNNHMTARMQPYLTVDA